ncbi:MAG TPA: DUF3592 domain-containing protein [Acidobacteriaceae bacterium]|nr:DUF3592 domain-containing protein [Acidobacteriaceae bacterium]
MMSFSLRDSHVIGTLAAAVVCVGGAAAYLMLRRRPSEEELERERRAQLVRSGRIIDGTIMDIAGTEHGEGARTTEIRFIVYKYEIGGVEYECSQDVTTLRDRVRAEELRLSFPCSVRYDVRRPENSIVVAENWSGLRVTAQSVTGSAATTERKPRSSAPAR